MPADESKTDSDTSYALIHEASSFNDFEALHDPASIEAEMARGRGKGTVTDVIEPDEDDENGSIEYEVTVEEGRIKVNSGYVVRFIENKHRHLTAFDVKAVDALRDYPAPQSLIDALPPRIRGHLKEHGYVKVRGAYSPEERRFYGAQMGWDADDEIDPWDMIMEIMQNVSSTAAAVDYALVEHGPDRWDIDEVAAARGIDRDSVRSNVRAVTNELDKQF